MEELKKETKSQKKVSKDLEINERKNNTAIIALVVLILVVAIGIGGLYLYRRIQVSDPVKITTKMINDLGASAKDSLKTSKKFFEGNKPYVLTINGDVSDINFNIENGVDLKNEIFTIFANVSGLGKDDLYLDGLLKKDSLLFKVAKDGNSYTLNEDLKSVFDVLKENNKNTQNDFSEEIVSYFADSFAKTFTKEDFKKNNKNMSLDGKDVKVTTYDTKINDKKLATLFEKFLDKLVDNEDFINTILEMNKKMNEEVTKKEIIESIKEIKDNLADEFEDISIFYSVLVYNSKAVGFILSIDDADIILEYTDYKDQKVLKVDIEELALTITDNKEEFTLSVDAEETPIVLAYNKKEHNYNLKAQSMPILNGTYETKETKNAVEVKLTFNSLMLGLKGSLNTKLELVDSLKVKSFKNALDISKQENMNKLMKEIENNDFIKEIKSIVEGFNKNQMSWDSIDGFDL